MDSWETISSLATGAGTLVLAVATFAAVRSSNRSARIAELALQEQRRPQTRDLYIPASDVGLWQGAIRERSDPTHDEVARAISQQEPLTVELVYSDQVGSQRTITRWSRSAGRTPMTRFACSAGAGTGIWIEWGRAKAPPSGAVVRRRRQLR